MTEESTKALADGIKQRGRLRIAVERALNDTSPRILSTRGRALVGTVRHRIEFRRTLTMRYRHIISCGDPSWPSSSFDVEDDVAQRLKRRAKRHGRSMEDEVRHILQNATKEDHRGVRKLGSRMAARFKTVGLTRTCRNCAVSPRARQTLTCDHPRHQCAVGANADGTRCTGRHLDGPPACGR